MEPAEFIAYARKFLVALVAALGVAAIAVGSNGIQPSEWVQILIAFAGALGVYQIPNERTK